ncbi:MAG: hypothetical protein HZB26_26195 [Candidatus Hydrogenedentes bacterium]|nr:hypothetical protein [Candidatus Hydrogenedentota bacterium]
MRIEEFLAAHGMDKNENPFSSGEEAQGDQVFLHLLHEKGFKFGHPLWPKFSGNPPGNQSAVVIGSKGSGKTAMRLALETSVQEHNKNAPADRAFLVRYDDFSDYLEAWSNARHAKNRTSWWSRIRKKTYQPTLHDDWALAHLLDGILSEIAKALCEELKSQNGRLPWDAQARYDALFLLAAYLPGDSSEYENVIRDMESRLFSRWDRVKRRTKAIASAGVVPAIRWFNARAAAGRVIEQIEVIPRQTKDLVRALRRIPPHYLTSQPLVTASAEASRENQRYAHLRRLAQHLGKIGYQRIVVVVDKVDEPLQINGDPGKMFHLVKPLLNNKVLQTKELTFKLLLSLEIDKEIQKQGDDFDKVFRPDKANLIRPLTWTGEHLYEMLTERARACFTDSARAATFSLSDVFEDSIDRGAIVTELDKTRIPRTATKFLGHCLTTACQSELNSERPLIPRDVWIKAISTFGLREA